MNKIGRGRGGMLERSTSADASARTSFAGFIISSNQNQNKRNRAADNLGLVLGILEPL